MPIKKEAVEAFLKKRNLALDYKGRSEAGLQSDIIATTGLPYHPITPPRQHQLEGLAFALKLKQALLFFDMRTGKSLIALDWARHLRRSGLWRGKGLVVAHAPIGLDVWQGQADQHSSLKLACVRNKPEQLLEALQSDADLIVIPWTGLQSIFSVK